MLEAPAMTRAAKTPRSGRASTKPAQESDSAVFRAGPGPASRSGPDDFVPRRAPSGLRLRVSGNLPRSLAGRLAAGLIGLAALAGFTGSLWAARAALLHDPRLILPSSDQIEITGNAHLTKAQLLSVFGEDIDRNLLSIPLTQRQTELEALPWVEHAAVMRLLPDHLRVAIVERTPVAFVRQGGEIGFVDAHGVLLEMSPQVQADTHYSFPVVTGISTADPLSTRAARMKLFLAFVNSLDSASGGGAKVSSQLSEVDLSDPEDIKALIPSGGSDLLVHFGQEDFLARYQRFAKHLPEWKTQFPKLASADMRYDRDVVLEMQPGSTVAPNTKLPDPGEAKSGDAKVGEPRSAAKPSGKKPAHASMKSAGKRPGAVAPALPARHSEQAFDVPAKHKAVAKPKPPAQGNKQ